MYAWARGRPPGLVLIAGHTHRPVFGSSTPDPPPTRPIEELERRLREAVGAGDTAGAGALRAELEYARTAVRRPEVVLQVEPPCYFNTGCCSFPDGDVTGLELADGEIRLVRWPANIRELLGPGGGGVEVHKRVLDRERLDDVLRAVTEPRPAEGAAVVETEIRPA
jgi:hypothetical protein